MNMTRSEWFIGVATTVLVIIAGTISFDHVNRRYFAALADRHTEAQTADQAAPSPDASSGACVDGDGSWKNWTYPNVPMLSPKCDTSKENAKP